MEDCTRKILVVEDDQLVRKCMSTFLERKGFTIIEAENGEVGLKLLDREQPDLLLLDLRMPVMDGIEVLKHLSGRLDEFPAIVTSGVGTIDDAIKSLRFGAWDYLTKPINNMETLLHAIHKALERRDLILEHKQYRVHLEKEVKKRTEKLRLSEQSLKESLLGTINVVATVVEMRDPYTAGHQKRVADLALEIAGKMGLDELQQEGLLQAAIIHDLGKVAVPSEILAKPGRLSELEYSLVQTHVEVGYNILTKNNVEFPWPIATIVRQHHERYNGSGYPFGITNEEILLEAKILAVADVVEAMASHRPYRHALGIDPALAEIRKNRGILYEPDVVDNCLRVFQEDNYNFIDSNILTSLTADNIQTDFESPYE